MITNIDKDIILEKSAWYYSMTFWVRYDCTEDNYFFNLMHHLKKIQRRAEHLFMLKLGLERYNRIIDHNKGHGPIKLLYTTAENCVEVRVELEHCGCGEEE